MWWWCLFSWTLSLRLNFSFEDTNRLSIKELGLISNLAIEIPSNFNALSQLLNFGDNGLRQAMAASCSNWTKDIYYTVRDYVGSDVRRQGLFISRVCIQHIVRANSVGYDFSGLATIIGVFPESHEQHAKAMLEAEVIDKWGVWWRDFPKVDWDELWRHSLHYMEGPLFRLAFLELINLSWYHSILTNSFGHFALTKAMNPEELAEGVYGLLRLGTVPDVPSASRILTISRQLLENHSHDPILTHHCTMLQWLDAHLTSAEKQGIPALDVSNAPVGILKSLTFLIAFVQDPMPQRHKYLDEISKALVNLSTDEDLANFFEHAVTFPSSRQWIAMMLRPEICIRLMRTPPPRDTYSAVLLTTELSTAYFRRWIAKVTYDLTWARDFSTKEHIVQSVVMKMPLDCFLPLEINMESTKDILEDLVAYTIQTVSSLPSSLFEDIIRLIVRLKLYYDVIPRSMNWKGLCEFFERHQSSTFREYIDTAFPRRFAYASSTDCACTD